MMIITPAINIEKKALEDSISNWRKWDVSSGLKNKIKKDVSNGLQKIRFNLFGLSDLTKILQMRLLNNLTKILQMRLLNDLTKILQKRMLVQSQQSHKNIWNENTQQFRMNFDEFPDELSFSIGLKRSILLLSPTYKIFGRLRRLFSPFFYSGRSEQLLSITVMVKVSLKMFLLRYRNGGNSTLDQPRSQSSQARSKSFWTDLVQGR